MSSTQTTPCVIGHFDIAGEAIGPLANFYQAMFGWDVTPRGPGYALVDTPGLKGAMVEAPDPGLTFGIVVADLEAALDRAIAEGGSVKMSAMDNGWVRKGQICDPAGNLLTLIQG